MKLFKQIAKQSEKLFPNADTISHLNKVKEEIDEAIKCPIDMEEFADYFMAGIAAMHKAGMTLKDLKKYVKKKLKKNYKREWIWDAVKKQYHHI